MSFLLLKWISADSVISIKCDLHHHWWSSPGRYVLNIHFYIESGQKMIQFNIPFKTKSKIFIQQIYSFKKILNYSFKENIHSSEKGIITQGYKRPLPKNSIFITVRWSRSQGGQGYPNPTQPDWHLGLSVPNCSKPFNDDLIQPQQTRPGNPGQSNPIQSNI